MRRLALVATVALALLSTCGFPEPKRAPTDGQLDSPIGTDDFSGGISVGGGILVSGTTEIVDDGLESADWACASSICVSGGVTP
jgi:hypothetical protein